MKMVTVTNRSGNTVIYRIPEDNIRREFAPGEPKQVDAAELEKLSHKPGGYSIINKYLLISDPEVIDDLGVVVEPEYYMEEPQVKELLINGSLEEFLDCLDFAPAGVLQMVKNLAVALPLNDVAKRKAIKDKLGFDVDKAVANVEAEKAEEKALAEGGATKERRVKKEEPAAAPQTGRRTTPKYNVVHKDD